MIRVALLASTFTLRAGLRSILTGAADPVPASFAEIEIVFEAGSLGEYLQFNPQTDVLLLEGELIDHASLSAIAAEQEGQVGVLALCSDPGPAQILRRLPLRGWGLLPLDVSGDELQTAVRAVAEGLLVGAPRMLEPLFSRSYASANIQPGEAQEVLTGREREILQLLALGLANKQIAQQLAISEHTVKFHISSIYSRLGVASRTEAVRAGLQQGLITL